MRKDSFRSGIDVRLIEFGVSKFRDLEYMKPMSSVIRALMVVWFAAIGPILISATLLTAMSSEASAAVAQRIEVRGNTRMDSDTVISYITIKPGKSYSSSDIDNSVKLLFGTGLFSDVSIYRSGSTLVVEVDENATVNKVFFEGNKRLKDVVLTGTVQTKARSIFSDQKVASDVERISEDRKSVV